MQPSNLPSSHAPVSSSGFPLIRVALLSGLLVLGLTACDATRNPLTTDGIDDVTASKGNTKKLVTVSPRDTSIAAVGWTVQLSVSVVNGGGKVVSDPTVTWQSLDPEIATVNATGLVTAVDVGDVKITAKASGSVDTATVRVRQVVTSVEVTPAADTLYVNGEEMLSAIARDGAGNEVPRDVVWRSRNPAVAKVDSITGLVTAVDAGTVIIEAESLPEGVKGISTITVKPAAVPPPVIPPPPGDWNRVLQDTLIVGDLVVPDGEKWLIGRGVRVEGNVRTVNGTIALRPGSHLTLVGGNPDEYVGGGKWFGSEFARDIGVWVGGPSATGKLDISCTPKRGWNRTGVDPTWNSSDEYFIAPTAVGDYTVRHWTPGNSVPQVDARVPAAEVANATRDCVIRAEPAGHIHMHTSVPQRIEYLRLENMGVTSRTKPNISRYALHFHIMGEAARGSVVRGVVSVNSRGRVFVPHGSHGVTMEDNVAIHSAEESLWWDHLVTHDRTHDLTVNQLLVLGTYQAQSPTIKPIAILLGSGDRNVMRNSAVTAMRGYEHARGFTWDANGDDLGPDVWTLEDNVAHNNRGIGLRIYNTRRLPHVTTRFTGYRNGQSGIESGGYASANTWRDIRLIEDRLAHHSNSRTLGNGTPGSYRGLTVESRTGAAIVVTKLSIVADPTTRWEFADCTLRPAAGHPKVRINSSSVDHPWRALFRRCGMTPDDIEWTDYTTGANIEGSSILVEHEDGRRWEVTVANGVKVVTELP